MQKEAEELSGIDVIIPLYKPGKEFFTLLDSLENQTVSVNRIILMNTGREFFEQLTAGTDFQGKYTNVQVVHLRKEEFGIDRWMDGWVDGWMGGWMDV